MTRADLRRAVERHRHLLDLALGALLRRKGRHLALTVVYAAVVFLAASVLLSVHALRREADALLRDAPEVLVQRTLAGRHDLLPARHLEALRAIPGVTAVRGRLWGYWFDPETGANYTVMAPEDRPYGWGEVRVGQGVARTRGLAPGGTLVLRAYDGEPVELVVREVLPAASELVTTDLVLVSALDFRRLFGIDADRFTDAAVTVANPAEVPTVAAKAARLLPDARVITRRELARTYEAIFDWRGGLALFVLGGALLAFAILAFDRASGLSAEERREIGVLKAVGWDTADVLLLQAFQGAAVSLVAFAAGLALAWLQVFHGSAPLLRAVLQGWSRLYPEFRPVPEVSGLELATLFVLTVVPYTVATLVPAWRAATIDPDLVMRA